MSSKKCIGNKLADSPFAVFSIFMGFCITLISLGNMFINWEVDWFIVRWAILGLLMYAVPVFYAAWECKNEKS